jgi:hypothetical protein
MDLSVGPDGNLYVGTHGRGIWRIPLPPGSLTAPSPNVQTTTTGTGTTGGGQPATGGKGHDKKPSPGRSKK